MKKIMTLIAALLVSATTLQASCEPNQCETYAPCDPCFRSDGFYIGGFGGANWLTGIYRYNDANTGYILSGSLGYRFCRDFRFEFEYAYRHNSFKSQKWQNTRVNHISLNSHAFLVNALWDIPFFTRLCVKPFIGGGIGYEHVVGVAHVRGTNNWNHKSTGDNFAWQLIAGLAYPICDSIDATLEYRLFNNTHYTFNQSVGLGLKYYF